jgi:hypothetical protein
MRVSNEPGHVADLAAYLSSIEGAVEEQLGSKVYPYWLSGRESVFYKISSRLSHLLGLQRNFRVKTKKERKGTYERCSQLKRLETSQFLSVFERIRF